MMLSPARSSSTTGSLAGNGLRERKTTHVVLRVGIAVGHEQLPAALVVSILTGQVKRCESPKVLHLKVNFAGLAEGFHAFAVSLPAGLVQSGISVLKSDDSLDANNFLGMVRVHSPLCLEC